MIQKTKWIPHNAIGHRRLTQALWVDRLAGIPRNPLTLDGTQGDPRR